VLPGCHEALVEESFELYVGRSIHSAEDFDVLERELERRGLETDIAG
jgi:hypothetical protein